eukprot:jgi/Mesvir1/26722/Mv20499-RA.1
MASTNELPAAPSSETVVAETKAAEPKRKRAKREPKAEEPPAAPTETPATDSGSDESETKKTKKAPYMSTSIPNMSVGDVRKCLNEIRRAGSGIEASYKLANGWTAGDFALKYLIGNYTPSSKEKAAVEVSAA